MKQVRSEKDLEKVANRELNKELMKPRKGAESLPKFDRIKAKLAKDSELLTQEEEKTINYFKEIRNLQINCNPKNQIAALMVTRFPEIKNARSVYKMIDQANAFWGEVDDLDKHAANKVLAETYLKIANQFSNNLTWKEKDEDTQKEKDIPQWKVKAAMMALEQYQKILGLDDLKNQPIPQPLPMVQITSNPEAIGQQPRVVYVEDVDILEDAPSKTD